MWIKSDRKSLPEYLKEIPKTASHQDWYMTEDQRTRSFKLKFTLLQEGLTHSQLSKNLKKGTITQDLFAKNLITECISWLKANCPHKEFYSKAGRLCRTCIHYMEHCIQKLAQGLG